MINAGEQYTVYRIIAIEILGYKTTNQEFDHL